MIDQKYIEQVRLLLRILPVISRVPQFALHGGTAINLFYHNMPRLSVDIDLTYIPYKDRETDLKSIQQLLIGISNDLMRNIPILKVQQHFLSGSQYKLFCTLGKAKVKIEVNSIIRGVIAKTEQKPLCPEAQNTFEGFVEMNIVPESQLFGGKIVAALDRQHPRDFFDTKKLLDRSGFTDDIMTGFLFCLLNSNRPIHEILQPVFIDQKSALDRQFKGMANEVFTYETLDYERIRLLRSIYNKINDVHKQLIIGFVCNRPIWPLGDWSKYPGVAWKMQNLQILQSQNPKKFEQQAKQVEDIFQLNAR